MVRSIRRRVDADSFFYIGEALLIGKRCFAIDSWEVEIVHVEP